MNGDSYQVLFLHGLCRGQGLAAGILSFLGEARSPAASLPPRSHSPSALEPHRLRCLALRCFPHARRCCWGHPLWSLCGGHLPSWVSDKFMNLFFQRGKGVRKFLEVDTSTYFLKPRMFPSVGSGPLAPPQPSPMPYVFVTTDRCV